MKPKRTILARVKPLRKSIKQWLGRQDSNLGMAESKSAALPLGYAPSGGASAAARADHSGEAGGDQRLATIDDTPMASRSTVEGPPRHRAFSSPAVDHNRPGARLAA
jgi:hypothetical protein